MARWPGCRTVRRQNSRVAKQLRDYKTRWLGVKAARRLGGFVVGLQDSYIDDWFAGRLGIKTAKSSG